VFTRYPTTRQEFQRAVGLAAKVCALAAPRASYDGMTLKLFTWLYVGETPATPTALTRYLKEPNHPAGTRIRYVDSGGAIDFTFFQLLGIRRCKTTARTDEAGAAVPEILTRRPTTTCARDKEADNVMPARWADEEAEACVVAETGATRTAIATAAPIVVRRVVRRGTTSRLATCMADPWFLLMPPRQSRGSTSPRSA